MFRYRIETVEGSYFRVEKDNRVRLTRMPENRLILIGYLDDYDRLLILEKKRMSFGYPNHNISVPIELIEGIPLIEVISLVFLDTGKKFCALVSDLKKHGRLLDSEVNLKQARQTYCYIEEKYWKEVHTYEDMIYFKTESEFEGKNVLLRRNEKQQMADVR